MVFWAIFCLSQLRGHQTHVIAQKSPFRHLPLWPRAARKAVWIMPKAWNTAASTESKGRILGSEQLKSERIISRWTPISLGSDGSKHQISDAMYSDLVGGGGPEIDIDFESLNAITNTQGIPRCFFKDFTWQAAHVPCPLKIFWNGLPFSCNFATVIPSTASPWGPNSVLCIRRRFRMPDILSGEGIDMHWQLHLQNIVPKNCRENNHRRIFFQEQFFFHWPSSHVQPGIQHLKRRVRTTENWMPNFWCPERCIYKSFASL